MLTNVLFHDVTSARVRTTRQENTYWIELSLEDSEGERSTVTLFHDGNLKLELDNKGKLNV